MNIMEDVLIYDETGKEVTGVKNKSVATIVIPDGVTSIGERAFSACFHFCYHFDVSVLLY